MDLRRAAIAAAMALSLLAAPVPSPAQPTSGTIVRIAYLTADALRPTICGPDPTDVAFSGLRDGLRELGYVEGVHIAIDCRSAEGQHERLPALARELLEAKPHVFVASAVPASLAAKAATTTVPIVSVYTADPVGLGIVASMARPGGNVTGTVPDIESQIGTVARSGIGAVLVMHQAFTFTNRALFVDALGKRRLPAMFGSREAVEAGGLMSYAVSVGEGFRRTAVYVDKIIKGARPGELPVEQPTRFELALNLRTARALGISIPASVLARAERVIE